MRPQSNRLRGQWLSDQIELRLRVLQRWESDGVPEAVDVPESLNRVRLWRDAKYGIEPIGSPSSFTTTHPTHGADIIRIRRLLQDLRARARGKRTRGDSAKLLGRERQRLALCKEALSQAASRFVQLSVELSDTKRRLRVAQSSLETVERELRERLERERRETAKRSSGEVLGLGASLRNARGGAAIGADDPVGSTE